jgi:hypothetical protein
MLPALRQAN